MEDRHGVPCPYCGVLRERVHGFLAGGVSLPGAEPGVNFCDGAIGFFAPTMLEAPAPPFRGGASGFVESGNAPFDFCIGALCGIGVAFAFTKNVRVRSR